MLKIEGKVGVNAACKQNCSGETGGAEREGTEVLPACLSVHQPGSEFELCITDRGGRGANGTSLSDVR